MGLDNGIEIKKYNDAAFKEFPEHWVHIYGEKLDKTTYVEPVYMRKWWGVRNDIVNYLNYKYHTTNINDGRWELTATDLNEIIDIYVGWLDEEKWCEEGESIWNWEDADIAGQIGHHIADINKLINIQDKYPNIIIEFYDSY